MMMRLCSRLVAFISLASTSMVLAADKAAVIPAKPVLDVNASLTVLFSLILIVALIFLLAWCLKRFGVGNVNSNQTIKVISTVAFSTKDKVALIEAGDKQLLIGVSPGRINTLHVFDEKIQEAEQQSAFSSVMASVGKDKQANNSQSDANHD